jgi:hypothetical protein
MRYFRELITDLSPSTQFVLIGLLAVASVALFTRTIVFFQCERAGIRPIYPSGWSEVQCRALEMFRLLVGVALIPLWGAFIFITPSVATKSSVGCNLNVIFIILLLLISNAWVLLLTPRNWERFGAITRSFSVTITFLVVWWGATFTATGLMFAKASASPTMHSVSGVYAAQKLPPLARTAS